MTLIVNFQKSQYNILYHKKRYSQGTKKVVKR
nr:MAG TPA: hypothetical protein [Caudoviricetes sp.]